MTWILWHKAANDGETSSNEAQKKGEKHLNEDIFTKRRDITDIDLPTVLEKLMDDLICCTTGSAGLAKWRINPSV